jgi:hypothetical protein
MSFIAIVRFIIVFADIVKLLILLALNALGCEAVQKGVA